MSFTDTPMWPESQDFFMVETTLGNESDAMNLAKTIVGKSLAACVRVVEAKSCFRWDGKECVESEFVLTAKTSAKLLSKLVNHIRANHPYDLPEIITMPFRPSKAYGDWVNSEVQP